MANVSIPCLYKLGLKLGLENPYDAVDAFQHRAEELGYTAALEVSVTELYRHGCFGVHIHICRCGHQTAIGEHDSSDWCLFQFHPSAIENIDTIAGDRPSAAHSNSDSRYERSRTDDGEQLVLVGIAQFAESAEHQPGTSVEGMIWLEPLDSSLMHGQQVFDRVEASGSPSLKSEVTVPVIDNRELRTLRVAHERGVEKSQLIDKVVKGRAHVVNHVTYIHGEDDMRCVGDSAIHDVLAGLRVVFYPKGVRVDIDESVGVVIHGCEVYLRHIQFGADSV